jgi:aryl-alcohol dehydrogenase-like predicted oxidoreductase
MLAEGHRQLTGDDHHLINLLILPAVHAGGAQGEPDLGRSARTIGERKHPTPARIALAWLLAQEPWIVPIPGTTKRERLEENIGAADVELTSEELAEIDGAASEIRVEEARYTENLVQMTGR